MRSSDFMGPVFIVGMPRSGTKLLRDLLNQNPQIGIPVSETHFIPYMVDIFGKKPDLYDKSNLDLFYKEFKNTPFYKNMEGGGYELTRSDLDGFKDRSSWGSLLENIFRFYAPKERNKEFIYGDKTPGYINHISLLKDIFPKAKFIHIIRDPRDYALSVRKAWRKSIFRAAENWFITLSKYREEGQNDDYIEVYYENLLQDPSETLKEICGFLSCNFTEDMLSLKRPAENLGDAKGLTNIVHTNFNKFKKNFSMNEIKRIEEITYPVIENSPYLIEYAKKYKPLSSISLKVFKVYDGYASVRFHIKEKGLLKGLNYFYILHKKSSWRV